MTNVFDNAAAALLAQLSTKCGAAFDSYSRGVLLYDDVIAQLNRQNVSGPTFTFPMLWLYEGVGLGGGTIKYDRQARGRPTIRTVTWTLVIYALKPNANTPQGADPSNTGQLILNPLLAVIEAAFVPDFELALTLGGLVQDCWIEGDVYSIPGDIDPTGLVMQTVPVKLLIP